MDLGHRDRSTEEDSAIQCPPLAVRALNAVRDDEVGVELRVTAARVPVIEGASDQTFGLELCDAASACPCKGGVLLKKLEYVVDGLVVRCGDLFLYADVGCCP